MRSFLNLLVNCSQSYFVFLKFMVRTSRFESDRNRGLAFTVDVFLDLGFNSIVVKGLSLGRSCSGVAGWLSAQVQVSGGSLRDLHA